MEIIHENEYVYKMNDEIEPYLATHRQRIRHGGAAAAGGTGLGWRQKVV